MDYHVCLLSNNSNRNGWFNLSFLRFVSPEAHELIQISRQVDCDCKLKSIGSFVLVLTCGVRRNLPANVASCWWFYRMSFCFDFEEYLEESDTMNTQWISDIQWWKKWRKSTVPMNLDSSTDQNSLGTVNIVGSNPPRRQMSRPANRTFGTRGLPAAISPI